MTKEEQALADDKMRAEIAKLAAETAKINGEAGQKAISDADRMMSAQIAKLAAETAKINAENKWYPLVVGSGMTLAIVAIVKLFL